MKFQRLPAECADCKTEIPRHEARPRCPKCSAERRRQREAGYQGARYQRRKLATMRRLLGAGRGA